MGYQAEWAAFSKEFSLTQSVELIVEKAKLLILDSITAIIYGNQSTHISQFIQHVPPKKDFTLLPTAEHTLYGTHFKLDSLHTAMIHGMAMVAHELDEGNPLAKGHPACHFLPALLVYSDAHSISGRQLLESFIVGYEISARTGAAITLKESIHPHGNWGIIGAAAAIGKLAGFSKPAYEAAFRLAAELPQITLWQSVFAGERTRDMHIGLNNLHTLLLPALVYAGLSGSRDGLEAVYNNGILGAACDQTKLVEGLGTTFYLMQAYFKLYPFCRFCHAPIDGVRQLQYIPPEKIKSIQVYTYSLASRLSHREVPNAFAGKFSIPYAIAGEFYKEGTKQHREFMKRVFVFEDPQLTKLLPKQRNARIEAVLYDGSRLEVEVSGASGDWNDERVEEKVVQKCMELLLPIFGRVRTQQLIDVVLQLEKAADIRDVTKLIAL